ncbi:MAG: alpha/beta hydrolase [bacterium]
MAFKQNSITINCRKAFYWEKNKQAKETIVLLHGFPGSHEGLLAMASGLGNYRLIIPDLPACGLSEQLEGKHNLENYSDWLNSFLKSLNIDSVIIVGHSFGSRVGLVFSSHYPQKVKRLVLITPVVKVEGLIARFVAVEYEIAKILPAYLRRSWLSNRVHRNIEKMILYKTASQKRRHELIAMETKELMHLNPQINIELFDEFYKFSLVPVGKRVKTKTLVIAGEFDEVAPLDSVQELEKQLIDSELVIMEKCGHIVVGEKPLTTAKIISKWLE